MAKSRKTPTKQNKTKKNGHKTWGLKRHFADTFFGLVDLELEVNIEVIVNLQKEFFEISFKKFYFSKLMPLSHKMLMSFMTILNIFMSAGSLLFLFTVGFGINF